MRSVKGREKKKVEKIQTTTYSLRGKKKKNGEIGVSYLFQTKDRNRKI